MIDAPLHQNKNRSFTFAFAAVLLSTSLPAYCIAQSIESKIAELKTSEVKSLEASKVRSTVTTSALTIAGGNKNADGSLSPSQQIQVIQVKGTISRKLLAKLQQTITSSEVDPIPAGLIVFLDSKGGDGMAAIEIGRMLRRANAHVFVNGECSSACILLLAGGVVRGAPTFSVGIHQARITLSSDAGVIKKEVDVSENPVAKALLQKFDQSAKVYFADMEIPLDLFIAMQAHPTKRVYRLSSSEITAYGLNGIEENYLKQRTLLYAQRPGRWPKDEDELLRRTTKVSTECIPHDADPVEFTKCYRKVLQDIF